MRRALASRRCGRARRRPPACKARPRPPGVGGHGMEEATCTTRTPRSRSTSSSSARSTTTSSSSAARRRATRCSSTPPTSTSCCSSCASASACARSSRPTATGTTSRPSPRCATPATRWPCAAEDAAMLPAYDLLLEDDAVLEVGRLRLRTIAHARPYAGVDVLRSSRDRRCCSTGDTLFPGGPGNTKTDLGDFPTIIESIERRIFAPLPAETIVHARPRRRHDDRRRAPVARRVGDPGLVATRSAAGSAGTDFSYGRQWTNRRDATDAYRRSGIGRPSRMAPA